MSGKGGLDDGVFGIEACEARKMRDADTRQRQRADQHHAPRQRDLPRQPPHFSHILLVVHGVDHAPGAEKQQGLEERVREEVKDTSAIGTHAAGNKHIAELRAGRIGHHSLDVVLNQADGGGEKRRHRAHQRDDVQGQWRLLK